MHPAEQPESRPARLIAFDGVVVLAYAVVLLATGPVGPSAARPATGPAWEQFALAGAALLPLVVRRIWPLPVYLVTLTISVVAVLRDHLWDPLLPAAYALYAVTATRTPRSWAERWLAGLSIGVLVGAATLGVAGEPGRDWWRGNAGLLILGFLALLAAAELGRAARQRRLDAVRTAQRIAREAADEERLRIARELHDVVTHSMGLIAVKAGVANHVVRTRPEEAHEALRVIEQTSRNALNDMRRMLGVLRSEEEPADLAPAPGPEALGDLARRAGAELTAHGLADLPDGVGLAVHRIVQEALTNVAKHAGPHARCAIDVEADHGEVRLSVIDDGTNPPQPGANGHGLIGMRERVAMYAGTLTAGPEPGGGFAVRATLRYEAAR
ncbi:MAG: sensor histidine kinase [Hamadaea sp.]|uniref:sensor histidine kinase n=1 Tax=Hamadaea sp. TaxID=2024425 RepID=UPI0018373713|nr:sensor histidine kinase [Hamadaea sp.]NUR71779.1 sensor histidine kinase [Hamadaea sp.]NUT19093.1 sensor histidine kinase [Hamadaea sp.]